MISLMAATVMVAGSFTTPGQTPAAPPPEAQMRPVAPGQAPTLRVLLTEVRPDGTRGSMAMTSIGAEPRHVWIDPSSCGLGAGSSATFAAGTIAWRVTGRIVDQQGSLFTVEVDAARVSGQPAAGATVPLTTRLSLEERAPLDRAPISGPCGSGEMRLEVMVGSASSNSVGVGGRGGGIGAGRGGGAGAGAAAATSMGRGGGGGAGSASGGRGGAMGVPVTGTRPPSAAAGIGRGGGRGGGGGAGAISVPPGSVVMLRAPDPPVDAELWLVHHVPGSPEQSQPLTLRIGSPFVFPSVVVKTAQGPATVDVSGSIYERVLNGVADGLVVEIKRRIKGDGPPSVDYHGSSTQHLPMPGATDVVSFPIPNGMSDATRVSVAGADERRAMLEQVAASLPPARLLQGHSFELRLRVKK